MSMRVVQPLHVGNRQQPDSGIAPPLVRMFSQERLDFAFEQRLVIPLRIELHLEKVHLANGIRKVPRNAFKNCSSVADLYIPDTVAEIGEYAFAGCSNLRTIHLPAGIRKISKGMFMECKSLTKCFLADGIEVIEDDAFKGCSTMKKPWIPKNIKTISKTAFDNPEWGNM